MWIIVAAALRRDYPGRDVAHQAVTPALRHAARSLEAEAIGVGEEDLLDFALLAAPRQRRRSHPANQGNDPVAADRDRNRRQGAQDLDLRPSDAGLLLRLAERALGGSFAGLAPSTWQRDLPAVRPGILRPPDEREANVSGTGDARQVERGAPSDRRRRPIRLEERDQDGGTAESCRIRWIEPSRQVVRPRLALRGATGQGTGQRLSQRLASRRRRGWSVALVRHSSFPSSLFFAPRDGGKSRVRVSLTWDWRRLSSDWSCRCTSRARSSSRIRSSRTF